ncbi:MAG: hypothetical protein ACRC80_02455 [Waterburya sp.]
MKTTPRLTELDDRIRNKKGEEQKNYTQLGIVLSGTDTQVWYLSITPS